VTAQGSARHSTEATPGGHAAREGAATGKGEQAAMQVLSELVGRKAHVPDEVKLQVLKA